MVGKPARRSVAVIGGGIAGLAAARTLSESGFAAVTIFEKDAALGGLCGALSLGGAVIDRFYHVVLPGDSETRGWIHDHGLQDALVWSRAGSGFLGRGRLVPLNTALDFLRFPFLGPLEKGRLGWGILATSRSRKGRIRPGETAERWLRARFGEGVTEKIWLPLLRSKFGEAAPRAPASYMEETIRRLRGARRSPSGRERMAALRGGIHALVGAAEIRLRKAGVVVRAGTPVSRVIRRPGAGVLVLSRDGEERFDAAILALPGPERTGVLGSGNEAGGSLDPSSGDSLGVVAVVFALRRSLSPYYVINLLDPGLPFTGIIEATNVLPPETVGGLRLVYLPKYILPGHRLETASDRSVREEFRRGLRDVFPDLGEGDILHEAVVRARHVQPLGAPHPEPESARRNPAVGIHRAESPDAGTRPRTINDRISAGRKAAQAVLSEWDS